MGKFNFFRLFSVSDDATVLTRRHRSIEPEQNNKCANLTGYAECDLVSKIRSHQSQLENIRHRMDELERTCLEAPELIKFFASEEIKLMRNVDYERLDTLRFGEHNSVLLRYAIHNIDDVEKLCEEIKTIYNQEKLRSELDHEKSILLNKISEFKSKLGIK